MKKSRYVDYEYNYIRVIRILTVLLLILSIACSVLTVMLIKSNKKSNNSANSVNSNASSNTSGLSSEESATAALAQQLNDWNLKVVNKATPLNDNSSIETAKIDAKYARDVGMSFDARAVSYLNAMCAAADADGVNLLVISCFRPHARQVALFNNQLNKVKKNNPNLSEGEATAKASTVVAYPGTSEHELGLAVDLNSDEETFEQTAQFNWLKSHAAEYGFVLRYPRDKQSVTQIIYEPWHYRYVGKENAEKMNELNMCLEEYTEYLKQYTK